MHESVEVRHVLAASHQCIRHRLLDRMTESMLVGLLGRFTTERNVGLVLAESTADGAAVGIRAAKLAIHLDGKADGSKVAEWTVDKTVQSRQLNLLLCLHTFQSFYSLVVEEATHLLPSKSSFTLTPVHTGEFVPGSSDLVVCIPHRAIEAEEMGRRAVAGSHLTGRVFREAAFATRLHQPLSLEMKPICSDSPFCHGAIGESLSDAFGIRMCSFCCCPKLR